MAFDFGTYTKREYKNTFLQNVFITIGFDRLNVESKPGDLMEKWRDYVRFTFNNLEPDESFLDKEVVSISRNDDSLTMLFGKNMVGVLVGTANYHSFIDNVLPQLFKLKAYIRDVMGVSRINEISVRKINSWQFSFNNNLGISKEVVNKSLFSERLIKCQNVGTKDNAEKNIPNMNKYEWDEGLDKAIIRTLFIKKPENNFVSQILDTEVIRETVIELADLDDTAVALNDILYNMYHWCVSKKVIDLMLG